MTDAIRPLIAGNWKMNGLKSALGELEAMIAGAGALAGKADLLVCPPATLIAGFADRARGSKLGRRRRRIATPRPRAPIPATSRRRCSPDAGASAIIVGHSSAAPTMARPTRWSGTRRKPPGGRGSPPSSASARPRQQRDAGQTLDVCGGQLAGSLPDGATAANLVVAYEPVWAIGTGLTPTAADIEQVHRLYPRRSHRSVQGRGRQDPHSLRRLGQAVQRRGADGGRQRRRRAGRRRQPEGCGFPGDRGGVLAQAARCRCSRFQ